VACGSGDVELAVDMIVRPIGQKPAQTTSEDCGVKLSRWGSVEVDEPRIKPRGRGCFAAGMCPHRVPGIAIEAVEAGIEAAESHSTVSPGVDLGRGRTEGKEGHSAGAEVPQRRGGPAPGAMRRCPRNTPAPALMKLPPVYEEQPATEASRCLNCGICSECMQWRGGVPGRGRGTLAKRPKPGTGR